MHSGSFMELALEQAKKAASCGEVPVGAVIVRDNKVLTACYNRVEVNHDATAHAEILAIQEVSRLLNTRYLNDCTLYVTLEPCAMCAHAISLARVGKLVYGAYDPKGGGVEHGAKIFEHKTCLHKPNVIGGVQSQQAEKLLHKFFTSLRS